MNEYFGLFCALVCFIVIVFWLHFCPSKIPAKVGTHMAIKVGHLYCRICVGIEVSNLLRILLSKVTNEVSKLAIEFTSDVD